MKKFDTATRCNKQFFTREIIRIISDIAISIMKQLIGVIDGLLQIYLNLSSILLGALLVFIKLNKRENEESYFVCSTQLLDQIKDTLEFIMNYGLPIAFLLFLPPLNPFLLDIPLKHRNKMIEVMKHFAALREGFFVLAFLRAQTAYLRVLSVFFLLDMLAHEIELLFDGTSLLLFILLENPEVRIRKESILFKDNARDIYRKKKCHIWHRFVKLYLLYHKMMV